MQQELEAGHIGILLRTLLLSSYLSMTHIEHIYQALHIFRYLNSRPKSKLVFEATHPIINEDLFQDCYQVEFYWYASEAIPENKPVPRGNFMSKNYFVDANQAEDTEIGWYWTEICFYHNREPIVWFISKNNSVYELIQLSGSAFFPKLYQLIHI